MVITKVAWISFLRILGRLALPVMPAALDRGTSEMEADNLQSASYQRKVKIQRQTLTHNYRSYTPSYNAFASREM